MTPTQPATTSQSFEKSAIPLFLALKPSRILRTLTVSCHLLAVIAVFLSTVPLLVQLTLCIAITISLCYNHRQDSREQFLIWRAGNRWVIEIAPTAAYDEADQDTGSTDTATDTATAELKSIDFFSRWLVILTLRTATGRSAKYVIAFDALSENTFRLLRVRLRIEGFTMLHPEKNPGT